MEQLKSRIEQGKPTDRFANKRGKTLNELIMNLDGQNLSKGATVIIDGLKYRFDGKGFYIDKNAKKSADLQGKAYVEYFDKGELPDVKLQKKLELMQGKEYAPKCPFEIETLNNIEDEEIKRRIEVANKLEEYGVKTLSFDGFERHLSKIQWTGELQKKLELMQGKEYAPKCPFEIETLNNIEDEEIKRRIEVANKLEEYGVKITKFEDLEYVKIIFLKTQDSKEIYDILAQGRE